MRKINVLFSILISSLLFACGGGTNSKPSKPSSAPISKNPKASTTIKAFSLKNPVINANIKSGLFSFDWKAKSSDPYEVDVYVSTDAFLSETKDIRIFGKRCGSSKFFDCNEVANFSCNFLTDNKMMCKDSETTKGAIDISSLLISLPQTAYMVIEICNVSYTSCKVKSQKVKFQ